MKRIACHAVLIVTLFFVFSTVQAQEATDPYATPEPYHPIYPSPLSTTESTPFPTPTPTPKIVPGSPLSVGSATFEELLSQLDIMSIAQLVLAGLGLIWFIIISVTVAKRLFEKMSEEKKRGVISSLTIPAENTNEE